MKRHWAVWKHGDDDKTAVSFATDRWELIVWSTGEAMLTLTSGSNVDLQEVRIEDIPTLIDRLDALVKIDEMRADGA